MCQNGVGIGTLIDITGPLPPIIRQVLRMANNEWNGEGAILIKNRVGTSEMHVEGVFRQKLCRTNSVSALPFKFCIKEISFDNQTQAPSAKYDAQGARNIMHTV